MFIYLEESIVNSIANNDSYKELAVETVIRVARSRRKGFHLVSGSRASLQFLSACESLPDYVKAVYSKLLSELTQLKHSLGSIKMKVLVVSGDDVFKKELISDQVVVTVSIDRFDDLSLDAGSTFICEHSVDSNFYIKGTECYQSWARYFNGVPLSFDIVLGGGNTTSTVYENAIEEKKACLCIVDSDKKTPTSAPGLTAHQVQQVDRNTDYPLCSLTIIGSRELENLLPIRLMQEAINNCPSRQPVISDYFQSLDGPSDTRKYLDMKKGLKLGEIHHSECSDFKEFWSDFSDSGGFETKNVSNSCFSEIECNRVDDCTCYVIKGLGENILKQSVDKAGMYSGQKLAEMFPSYLRSDWEQLALIIFAWGCGSRKLSVL